MVVFPNAKINLGLHVVDKRSDGYHQIETVFYPVGLSDILEVTAAPDGSPEPLLFKQTGLGIGVPPEENTCVKAYRLLQQAYPLPAVAIHLHKIIPGGSGLGGGSADGTYTLKLLNQMFQMGIDKYRLASFALQLGSDCPFFIFNEPMLAMGRGELLKPIDMSLDKYYLMVVIPGIQISTRWAYQQVTPEKPRIPLEELIIAPVYNWKGLVVNQFEDPLCRLHPEIGIIRDTLYEHEAVYASMSGSGSAVFGLFNNKPGNIPQFSNYFTWTEKLRSIKKKPVL